jgi:hypothetical protein
VETRAIRVVRLVFGGAGCGSYVQSVSQSSLSNVSLVETRPIQLRRLVFVHVGTLDTLRSSEARLVRCRTNGAIRVESRK